jgi:ribosomal protein S18 acetylase RimI-like enzyme
MEMPDGYTIVRADLSHAALIAENNCRCLAEADGFALSLDVALRGVTHVLQTGEGGYFLLTGPRGEVVGQYKQTDGWDDLFARPVRWMEHLYVPEEYAGRGYGKLLVDHFVQTAGAEDGPRPFLFLHVARSNVKAIQLYQRQRFIDLEYVWMVHGDALRESGYRSELVIEFDS